MPVDGLALLGARPSPGRVMTKCGSLVYWTSSCRANYTHVIIHSGSHSPCIFNGNVITRSISTRTLPQTAHSSHVRVKYGVSGWVHTRIYFSFCLCYTLCNILLSFTCYNRTVVKYSDKIIKNVSHFLAIITGSVSTKILTKDIPWLGELWGVVSDFKRIQRDIQHIPLFHDRTLNNG